MAAFLRSAGSCSWHASGSVVARCWRTEPPSLWWLSRTLRGSCRYQNALSEQVEGGAAVALPLQQLEPIDLTFGLAAAPGFSEGSAHRGPVLLQPGGERLDGGDAARARLGKPGVQVGRRRDRRCRLPDVAPADESGEPTREGGDLGGLLVLLGPPDGRGVRGRQCFGRTYQQPRKLLGRGQGRARAGCGVRSCAGRCLLQPFPGRPAGWPRPVLGHPSWGRARSPGPAPRARAPSRPRSPRPFALPDGR